MRNNRHANSVSSMKTKTEDERKSKQTGKLDKLEVNSGKPNGSNNDSD
jgi:hypothetical protein